MRNASLGPPERHRLADGQHPPALANCVEACAYPLDLMVGGRSRAAPPRAHAAAHELLGARELIAMLAHEPLAAASQLAIDGAIGPMERGRVAARGELGENGMHDPPLPLDNEVRQVVRDQWVIAGRRMHHQPRSLRAIYDHRVPAPCRASKGHFHAPNCNARRLHMGGSVSVAHARRRA